MTWWPDKTQKNLGWNEFLGIKYIDLDFVNLKVSWRNLTWNKYMIMISTWKPHCTWHATFSFCLTIHVNVGLSQGQILWDRYLNLRWKNFLLFSQEVKFYKKKKVFWWAAQKSINFILVNTYKLNANIAYSSFPTTYAKIYLILILLSWRHTFSNKCTLNTYIS